MKLNILLRIIKFWIHLESLPENSIAKQCLMISYQLANEAKTSFMLTVNEIIHNYKDIHHQSYNKTIQTHSIMQSEFIMQKKLQMAKGSEVVPVEDVPYLLCTI